MLRLTNFVLLLKSLHPKLNEFLNTLYRHLHFKIGKELKGLFDFDVVHTYVDPLLDVFIYTLSVLNRAYYDLDFFIQSNLKIITLDPSMSWHVFVNILLLLWAYVVATFLALERYPEPRLRGYDIAIWGRLVEICTWAVIFGLFAAFLWSSWLGLFFIIVYLIFYVLLAARLVDTIL